MESVIEEQKTDINNLMQNQMLPRSPSPLPPEMKNFSMQTLQETECQTISLQDESTQTEVRSRHVITEASKNIFGGILILVLLCFL